MLVKTMAKGYVNLRGYSNFTVYHKKEGFAVVAEHYLSVASVELGCYPSGKEAQAALDAMMEHWDAIKEAEFYSVENDFRYISNVFVMPETSKSKTKDEDHNSSAVCEWIIRVCNSEADGVKLYRCEGTVQQIKSQLMRLVNEDREIDKDRWDYGSENESEISDISYFLQLGGDEKAFFGFGCYSEYHIDYTAERLSEIEQLKD